MKHNHLVNLHAFAFMASLLTFVPAVPAQTPPTPLPQVSLLASDPAALERTSSGAFTLIRNGPTNADLAVSLKISGTASNGVDYVKIPAVATIPAGFLAADILVQPIADNANTGNRTVVLTVQTNAAYQIAKGRATASVKIVDDVFNLPVPTITLTSPADNSEFKYRSPITLTAQVSDVVPVSSVSFYADDDFLGRATNSPYSLVWSNARPGHYALFARAADQIGQSVLSAPVHVTVSQIVPVVKIITPTNGMSFKAHDNIPLQADATDSDDAIQSVSFYANGRLLGVVTNTPYSMVWSNVPAGYFFVGASAVDTAGDKGSSPNVLIKVLRAPASR